ncbi:MAG TPA: SDR family oxidoreductase [Candidatus Binataceae bacterium]|nr:SDR family oxidoreductase [Candidatus Binataceae bacterium]
MADAKALSGKTAIVTGASSGIGRAIALRVGEAGAHVFVAGRNKSSLDAIAREIGERGGKASTQAFDIRDVKALQNFIAGAAKDSGGLDIMVNNAGLEFPSSIIEGDPDRWREMLEVNVLSLLVGSQAAIRAMRACGAQGHIVNISSVAGRSEASGVYGSTKWAVNSIATSLRKELEGDTIRVVNIMPGAVATNFARNFPPEFVQGIVSSLGLQADFKPGEQMPAELLDQVAKAGKLFLAAADDIARAVLYAVTQPIELNVFEMVVRPQRQLQLPS